MNYEEAINAQYGMLDLDKKILAILDRDDLDIAEFFKDILAPIEELHLHGRAATMELAKGVGLNENMRILKSLMPKISLLLWDIKEIFYISMNIFDI